MVDLHYGSCQGHGCKITIVFSYEGLIGAGTATFPGTIVFSYEGLIGAGTATFPGMPVVLRNCTGLARTIYRRCIYGEFDRGLTKLTVI